MKGLGLAGAGLGAAAAAAPVFHDLDEVSSSAQGETKHPWYVKELDLEKPTVEIDWSVYPKMIGNRGGFFSRFNSGDNATVAAMSAKRSGDHNLNYMQAKFPDYQGRDTRTAALVSARGHTRLDYASFDGSLNSVRGGSIGGTLNVSTPDVKWTGTPDENIKTMRSAARFMGAAEIGVSELSSTTKKLIYSADSRGKPYNFKSATVPEVTDSEYVIPNSCKNLLFFSTLEATDQVKQAPASTLTGYDHYSRVQRRIVYFIRALGYNVVDAGGITTSNSWGALTGVTEHSRAGHIATSYKYGNMFRGMHRILTDFPMTPTNPIDAGIAKFCETCKTCSEECPYECMDLGDKRWDNWDSEAESLMNYVPGFKGWRTNIMSCGMCKNCHTTCPFNAADTAVVHQIVRTTQAITPIFNGFFALMHKNFGYGVRNPDEWWERDVPIGPWNADFIKA
jgi:reductive dehalogenase